MMFAPRYTVFHCGYLKGEQEMSDTPRTDETQFKPSEEHPAFNLAQYMVKAEFARTLERENAAQLKELHCISEALGSNDGHSSVTHIEILKEENATLREQLKECSAAFDRQQEQLDRNAEQNAALQKDAERYRWLRNDSFGQFVHPIVVSQTRTERGINYIGPVFYESLDAAIDAAKGEGK